MNTLNNRYFWQAGDCVESPTGEQCRIASTEPMLSGLSIVVACRDRVVAGAQRVLEQHGWKCLSKEKAAQESG